jgi:hypothetical protein
MRKIFLLALILSINVTSCQKRLGLEQSLPPKEDISLSTPSTTTTTVIEEDKADITIRPNLDWEFSWKAAIAGLNKTKTKIVTQQRDETEKRGEIIGHTLNGEIKVIVFALTDETSKIEIWANKDSYIIQQIYKKIYESLTP